MDNKNSPDKENGFDGFMKNVEINFIYITFGSIFILFAIFCVKCCARGKRRSAKRQLERLKAEKTAWSTAKAEAAKSATNQIVHQNVVINVKENNKILNRVNLNEVDLAQPQPAPRSIFSRNAVFNDKRNHEKKVSSDEFELDELELEPKVDY